MITALNLAGSLAAHAIWSVSDGEILVPILGFTDHDDKRVMNRLVAADLAEAVQRGQQQLRDNPMDANDAVLLYDGRITLDGRKLDAIIVEVRAYFAPGAEAVQAVPYTPKSSGVFRVHRPKLLVWKGCEDFDMDQALQAFWDGVSSHEQANKVWTAALDESI